MFCIYAGTVILDNTSVLMLCFYDLHAAVCRETLSRVAAKCVCVQACTVSIVGKIFERFFPEMRVVPQK